MPRGVSGESGPNLFENMKPGLNHNSLGPNEHWMLGLFVVTVIVLGVSLIVLILV